MNLSVFTKYLNTAIDKEYIGDLSAYSVESIRKGRSNYPVANLLEYCAKTSVEIKLIDEVTEDDFAISSLSDIHQVINLLMHRYDILRSQLIKKDKISYFAPTKEELKAGGAVCAIPISIKTFLAICEAIHCKIVLYPK